MKHLISLFLLVACANAEPSLPPIGEDTCGANDYADLIGQDATALERVLLLGQVRVIHPGDMVTQDFRPDRINFGINDASEVIEISCG